MTVAPVFRVLLLTLFALAGVEAAIARGLHPVSTVVLCRGATAEVVTLGADGTPVRQSALCPDAGVAIFTDAGLPVALGAPDRRVVPCRFADARVASRAMPAPQATARAPPGLV
ncbi:hypothetical protein ATO8_07281 [Roseivivax marinus]|uniref:Uncharacterized protein n=1 Tax=Roseivivax marinus TaxID=1379903 RepID=W4HN21_9RHOB|nr:hypothetical protein [Roseivivax marinus]ETW13813.1 hypothetical protein ATO8_07281 [Roseivivax marinus]